MFQPSVIIENTVDIISCMKNYEALSTMLFNENENTEFEEKMTIIPFLRNHDTDTLMALGWSFGKPIVFFIKNGVIENAGQDDNLIMFIAGMQKEIADNLSNSKMVSIVINPLSGAVLFKQALFDANGPYVKVFNMIE